MINNDFKVLQNEITEIVKTNKNYKEVIIEMFNNANRLKKDKIAMVSKNMSANWMVDTIIKTAKENPNESTWLLFALTDLKSEAAFMDLIDIAMVGNEAVKMMVSEVIGQMTHITKLNKNKITDLCASYKRNSCNTVEETEFINNCIYIANTLPMHEQKTAKIYQFPIKVRN